MKIFVTRSFKWWEVSLLKLGLMSFGILVAQYFGAYVLPLSLLWWVLFVVSSVYFLIRLLNEN